MNEGDLRSVHVGNSDARGKPRVQTEFEEGSSLTVQSDQWGTSAAEIMKDFVQGKGLQDLLDTTELQFVDVTEFEDYADVMRHVAQAQMTFLELKPEVRKLFDNSVEKWLDSAHDDRRAPSAREARERAEDPAPEPIAPVTVLEPVAPEDGAKE